jgi:hypothetical protein
LLFYAGGLFIRGCGANCFAPQPRSIGEPEVLQVGYLKIKNLEFPLSKNPRPPLNFPTTGKLFKSVAITFEIEENKSQRIDG